MNFVNSIVFVGIILLIAVLFLNRDTPLGEQAELTANDRSRIIATMQIQAQELRRNAVLCSEAGTLVFQGPGTKMCTGASFPGITWPARETIAGLPWQVRVEERTPPAFHFTLENELGAITCTEAGCGAFDER